jgi:hypothetical protein
MAAQNEFWFCLHQLAQAYRAGGKTPPERMETIADEFHANGQAAQHEILDQLAEVSMALGDFYFKYGRSGGQSASDTV